MFKDSLVVGTLEIPASAANHKFSKHVEKRLGQLNPKADSRERVLGTTNTRQPELYGWLGNIPDHVDNQGFVYFMVINPASGVFYSKNSEAISYGKGDIIRMNDSVHHSVMSENVNVALFLGAFDKPCDDYALISFKEAVATLTAPLECSYETAPRYLAADCPVDDDECYILHDDASKRTLIALAHQNGEFIIPCSFEGCTNYAAEIDHHFPYHWERNVCALHRFNKEDEGLIDDTALQRV